MRHTVSLFFQCNLKMELKTLYRCAVKWEHCVFFTVSMGNFHLSQQISVRWVDLQHDLSGHQTHSFKLLGRIENGIFCHVAKTELHTEFCLYSYHRTSVFVAPFHCEHFSVAHCSPLCCCNNIQFPWFCNQTSWCSGNGLDSYSLGSWFKSWPGHQLPWLRRGRGFMVFLSPSMQLIGYYLN